MSKNFYERRKVKQGDFTYLVDDDDLTAWIYEGNSNGEPVPTLPEKVELEGRTFQIKSVEIGGYGCEANLEELFIPDCYEFIDEDAFRGCEELKTVHIGKGLEWYCKWSSNGRLHTVCPWRTRRSIFRLILHGVGSSTLSLWEHCREENRKISGCFQYID